MGSGVGSAWAVKALVSGTERMYSLPACFRGKLFRHRIFTEWFRGEFFGLVIRVRGKGFRGWSIAGASTGAPRL